MESHRAMKDWKSHYDRIKVTPDEAVAVITSGKRIFIETNCSEPLSLIEALTRTADRLEEVEIVQGFYRGASCPYAQPGMDRHFRITSFHASEAIGDALKEGWADYLPVHLYDIPRLCSEGPLPIDVALVQLSPPDEGGYCSFGITVNFAKPIAESAGTLIAEINDRMPTTRGETQIHVSKLKYAVEASRPLIELKKARIDPVSEQIASYAAELIPDGAALQVGIGAIPDAILSSLKDKKDLGIHTGTISDTMAELLSRGVITNARKEIDRGKAVTAMAMGTNKGIYRFVHDNPQVEFFPVSYTHDPFVIGRLERFVTLNSALQVDLHGQVNADTIRGRPVSGVGGAQNFIWGAWRSKGGKSIVALPSTAAAGKVSRIVSHLQAGTGVTTPRTDIHYVVTEFGVADLMGKTLSQRAKALTAIAHPDFREELKMSFERR
jgi:4-hydroxybutyrate CoA-transferase